MRIAVTGAIARHGCANDTVEVRSIEVRRTSADGVADCALAEQAGAGLKIGIRQQRRHRFIGRGFPAYPSRSFSGRKHGQPQNREAAQNRHANQNPVGAGLSWHPVQRNIAVRPSFAMAASCCVKPAGIPIALS